MSTYIQGGQPIIINPLPLPPGAIRYKVPNFTHRQSLMTNWCWAASLEMVLSRHNNPAQQCQVVNDHCKRTDCCGAASPACNITCKIVDIEALYKNRGLQNVRFDRNVIPVRGFHSIERELQNNRPVQIGWKEIGTLDSHILLVYGLASINGSDVFLIADPDKPVTGVLTYAELLSPSVAEQWVWTWTGLG